MPRASPSILSRLWRGEQGCEEFEFVRVAGLISVAACPVFAAFGETVLTRWAVVRDAPLSVYPSRGRTPPHARRPVRPGMVLLYTMMAMIALLAVASLAVDWGRLQLARTEIRAAVDAAARHGAGGVSLGTAEARSRAAAVAAQNRVDGSPLVLDQADVEFGTWNVATNTFTVLTGSAESAATAIRVTGRRTAARGNALPLHFARVLGMSTCDLQASSTASFSSQANDIFVVQDVTTSFEAELPSSKSGLQNLLSGLHSSGNPSRMAIAVHTGWGKTLAPLTPIVGNYTYLSSTINSIQLAGGTGMPPASGTDMSVGFDQAISAFGAYGYVAPPGVKAVVVVSDGKPSQDSDAKNSSLNEWELRSLAQTRANTLWSRKVHVYVVFMDTSNDTDAATFLRTLIRGDGDFTRVQYAADLPAALADLTKRVGGVQLVK